MRAPYTQTAVHFVWATWDRLQILTPAWKQTVLAAIQSQCAALKAEVIALEAMPDHVHLLVRLPATVTIADLIKHVKGASSHLVTHRIAPGEWFKWQGSYGAFFVSRADVPRIRRYVQCQEQHHRDGTLDIDLERTEQEEPGD